MDIIRKQRVNYTVTTTLIAAVFLLIVLGGLFGVVYGSNDMFINKALDKALEDPENYNNAVANDLRCIFIYKYDFKLFTISSISAFIFNMLLSSIFKSY